MCRRYLERASAGESGRLRVVAGIDFGADPADWREGQRFESVYNRLMGDAPAAALCLYDRRRLPQQVVDSAAATHPFLVHGTQRTVSAALQDPGSYVPPSLCRGSRSRPRRRCSSSRPPPTCPACAGSSAPCWPPACPTATSGRTSTWRSPRSPPTPSGTAPARSARGVLDRRRADRLRDHRPRHLLERPVLRVPPRARLRPLERRHGAVAGPQALGPRRRAARPRRADGPVEQPPALTRAAVATRSPIWVRSGNGTSTKRPLCLTEECLTVEVSG